MPIQLVDYSADKTIPIHQFSSTGSSSIDLAHGSGESHAYAIHFVPGGKIGPHPAGFDQLFLVVQGSGWVAGSDGVRHAVAPCHGAIVPKGEIHSKGSETGMVAIMVQSTTFDLTSSMESTKEEPEPSKGFHAFDFSAKLSGKMSGEEMRC